MICTSHPFHRMRRLTLSLALAVPHTLAQADARVTKLAAGAIQTKANGRIERRPVAHLPLVVEFDRGPALTEGMASALEAQGLRTTQDRSATPATSSIRGDLVLMGYWSSTKGPRFRWVKPPSGHWPLLPPTAQPRLAKPPTPQRPSR